MRQREEWENIPIHDSERLIRVVKNMERQGDLSCLATLERLLPTADVTARYYVQRAIRGIRRRHHLPEPALASANVAAASRVSAPAPSPSAVGPTARRADFQKLELSSGILRRLEQVLAVLG